MVAGEPWSATLLSVAYVLQHCRALTTVRFCFTWLLGLLQAHAP